MKDKVQKIREEVERLMYGFNLEADIASCEDAETEKLANIKYQLCKKILQYIDSLQEEPVSDDLEEAAELYMLNQDTYNSHVEYQIKGAFKAGAKWQKEQDQSTIELAEDHAMLAGMEKMKEEMMEKAFPAEIDSSRSDGRCILGGNFARFETGERVKVIVIKEG